MTARGTSLRCTAPRSRSRRPSSGRRQAQWPRIFPASRSASSFHRHRAAAPTCWDVPWRCGWPKRRAAFRHNRGFRACFTHRVRAESAGRTFVGSGQLGPRVDRVREKGPGEMGKRPEGCRDQTAMTREAMKSFRNFCTGVPGGLLCVTLAYGIMVPAGTPAALVAALNRDFNTVLTV
jgi:hypothetical protein